MKSIMRGWFCDESWMKRGKGLDGRTMVFVAGRWEGRWSSREITITTAISALVCFGTCLVGRADYEMERRGMRVWCR